MMEMKLISLLPSGNFEGALALLNQLKWNISLTKQGDACLVFGGEKCLLKASSEDAALAFVYGLALAHGVLPSTIFEEVRRQARAAVGE
jgi:hypothetical protein